MAAHDIVNVGIARLVAGVVFPMGLMMVVMTGAELFTGDCLAIMATVQKKHTALKLIRMLIVVYLGNLLGSLMLTCIDYVSGQYNYSSGILGAYTIKVALGNVILILQQRLHREYYVTYLCVQQLCLRHVQRM